MKPLKSHKWKRAAREKIAADLAHDLGVAVPPVLLAKNRRSDSIEPNVCVSLVMYPHQFSWGQIGRFAGTNSHEVGKALAASISEPCSRALVLDTWLQQTDHADHPSNIVFGYEGADYSAGRFLFLDFAFSMGISGAWDNDGFGQCVEAGFPEKMRSAVARGALEQAVEQVESLPSAVIDSVVERIPADYLPESEKRTIIKGLKARRSLVRGALEGYLS